jgi:hypothetical protein
VKFIVEYQAGSLRVPLYPNLAKGNTRQRRSRRFRRARRYWAAVVLPIQTQVWFAKPKEAPDAE